MEPSTSFPVTVETMTTSMSMTDDVMQPHHGLILACIYIVIAVGCVTCNLVVSCIVCVDRSLLVRPQPLLVLNMAVLDLIKGLLLIVFTIPTCLRGGAVYPWSVYLIYICIHTMWRWQSIVNITIISICRYIVVCRRHCRSLKKDSRHLTMVAMVMSWFLMLLGSILYTWTNTFLPDVTFTMATVQHTGNDTMSGYNNSSRPIYLLFLFVLPLAMSAFSFIQVAREFHNHPHGRPPLNGVNHQRFRREKGVTKMCGVMVTLRFLSETIAILADMFGMFNGIISNDVTIVMSLSRDCTCALNPLVYFIGNHRCRSNVRRMFSRICGSFRSNKVAPRTQQSVFQLERRMSLIQGSQGERTQQRPPMSVPDIFQVNRRESALDGYPILVVEFDNKPAVTSNQPCRHSKIRDENGDEADDNLDARSNLAPDSLLGNVSVMSIASSSLTGSQSPSKDRDDSLLQTSRWQRQASKSSEWALKRLETVSHGGVVHKGRGGDLPGVDGISSDPTDPDDLQNVLSRLPWYSYNHKSETDLKCEANVEKGKELE